MKFDLEETMAALSRTPAALNAMLSGLRTESSRSARGADSAATDVELSAPRRQNTSL
jgi:hypothetical protein